MHACQRIVRGAFGWFHGYMRTLALLDAEVIGSLPESAPPAVLVANHPTLVDVTAILAHVDGVCCVVKTSLVRNVFMGRLLRMCGHIDGGDGSAMSGAAVLQVALDRLARGQSILVFPEGTRSPPGGMHAFKRGAFEVAARAGVGVRPLFLTCNPPALSKGLPFWRQPSQVARLRIHPASLVEVVDARVACGHVEASFRQRIGIAEALLGQSPLTPPTSRPASGRARRPLSVQELPIREESAGLP